MESCSVDYILNSKCGAGKNNSYFTIDVDELQLGQVELLHIRSKTNLLLMLLICVLDQKLTFY